MRRCFIFDYDDTLANFPIYNSFVFKSPVKVLPPLGGLIKGSDTVLDEILKRNDKLQMLTMNIFMDGHTKWDKMNYVGISRWFKEKDVYMVRNKTSEKMLELCKGFRKDRCIMVGNSLKHDILPALEAGIKAIYIPRPRWKMLVPERIPESDDLYVLKDIRQVLDIYDEL